MFLSRVKHSSLARRVANYGGKTFCEVGHRCKPQRSQKVELSRTGGQTDGWRELSKGRADNRGREKTREIAEWVDRLAQTATPLRCPVLLLRKSSVGAEERSGLVANVTWNVHPQVSVMQSGATNHGEKRGRDGEGVCACACWCACTCVCVCMWEREREREREREILFMFYRGICACLKKGERGCVSVYVRVWERERERKS